MDFDALPLRRRVSKRREYPGAFEINITPVMNLFICLIPFLLISAVFVQLSIIETEATATSKGTSQQQESSLVMVVVYAKSLLVVGKGPVVKKKERSIKIKKVKGKHNYALLTKTLAKWKKNDPEGNEVLVLAAPNVDYQTMVEVLDATRVTADGEELFPNSFFGGTTS